MSAPAQKRLTPEEYLAIERAATEKSEYYDGHVYARSGASRAHDRAVGDIFGELRTQLRGGPCEIFTSDMRVKIEATNTYVYPDVTVACGELEFEDANVDILLNPTLIVEVLSPSTEAHDRGTKFAHYQTIPSLKEYVLVAQDRPRIEHYVRRENGHWDYSEVSGLDGVMHLPSIHCDLQLAEVYARVTFGSEEAA
jgi:Uma2 family endonuclease